MGFVVALLGYSVFDYGLSQVRGCNASFVDMIWPGRNPQCNGDSSEPSPNFTKTTATGKCPKGQIRQKVAGGTLKGQYVCIDPHKVQIAPPRSL